MHVTRRCAKTRRVLSYREISTASSLCASYLFRSCVARICLPKQCLSQSMRMSGKFTCPCGLTMICFLVQESTNERFGQKCVLQILFHHTYETKLGTSLEMPEIYISGQSHCPSKIWDNETSEVRRRIGRLDQPRTPGTKDIRSYLQETPATNLNQQGVTEDAKKYPDRGASHELNAGKRFKASQENSSTKTVLS